jgi:hypothetical protein
MKGIKFSLSVCFLSLFLVLSLNAQDNQSPVSIEQVANPGVQQHTEAFQEFGIDYSFTFPFISESDFDASFSNGNTGIIKQYGNQNVATLTQMGNSNYGKIIMGSPFNNVTGNEATVTQDGNNLISLVNIQGDNNVLNFTQDGDRMGALINFLGDSKNITLTQDRNNSLLGKTYFGGSSFSIQTGSMPAIKVESTKRVQPIIIRNN